MLIVAPTGAGKTIIASSIVASGVARGSRIIFVAHRRELIVQAYNKLIGCTCTAGYVHDSLLRDPSCRADGLPERSVGILMAGDRRRRPTAPVQVASIDTLRNRARPEAIDIILIDEAHRAMAKSYRDLVEAYPQAIVLGLTATPFRADNKGLGESFDDLVVVATPRELIRDGYLVEPRAFTVPASELPDLSHVRIKGGDYDPEALAVAVDQGGLVGDIVDHWARRAEGRRTVCFAASVAHSRHIAERFRAAGVAAEHLDGETPTAERDAILRRVELGQTRVVVNCGVLCEGWDQPSVKCAILARPTKSLVLYMQQSGRIVRPYQGIDALILDHAGCVLEHGLPSIDRDFSLEAKAKRARDEKRPSCKTCTVCFAILATATRLCPVCGYAWPAEDCDELAEAKGELVEVRAATEEEKRALWDQLVAEGVARGYAPGWATHRYKEKIGTWPPKYFPRAEKRFVDEPDDAKRAYLDGLRVTAAERGYQKAWMVHRFRARYGHEIPFEWMFQRVEAAS